MDAPPASLTMRPGGIFPTCGSIPPTGSRSAFLRADKTVRVELHHFVGHDPAILGLAHALDVPYEVVVHDYAWVCPRITLVGPDKRYCGEPGGDACEACYADVGGTIEEDIRPSRLRLRSQSVLAGAHRVVVPAVMSLTGCDTTSRMSAAA